MYRNSEKLFFTKKMTPKITKAYFVRGGQSQFISALIELNSLHFNDYLQNLFHPTEPQ